MTSPTQETTKKKLQQKKWNEEKTIKQKRQKNKESRKKNNNQMKGMFTWKKLHFNSNCQLSIPNLQEGRVGVSTSYYDKEQHKE